jgi:hypothetical protein
MNQKDREAFDRYLHDGQHHKEEIYTECPFCNHQFWCEVEIEYGAIVSETICPHCNEEGR